MIRTEYDPSVIDSFTPSLLVEAEWSSSNYASLGNTLKPKKLQEAPSISLHQPRSSSGSCSLLANMTYTVTITDPDAPSRDDPKWSEVCHWIATTAIPIDEIDTGSSSSPCLSHIDLSSSLQDVMSYKAPGPPEKTGKHRYVFFVFVPANGTTDPLDLTKPEDRQHWGYEFNGERVGVKKWALENGLAPIGETPSSFPALPSQMPHQLSSDPRIDIFFNFHESFITN